MSGTFDDEHGEINVPPTLVSFAVDVNSCRIIITPEFKKAGSKIVEFEINRDNYDLPDYAQIMDGYGKLSRRYQGWTDPFCICSRRQTALRQL